ncbi:hypothetical protein, partial [Fibrobacter intestinalis]
MKTTAASAVLLGIIACGDDSSSGSKTPEVFGTKDDLPECTEKIAGDTLYVESDSADYFCDDGEWVIVGDSTASDTTGTDTSDVSSSSGKNPSSSSADSSAVSDSLSSSSVADSLLSSSSAEVSSSSAITKEVVLACPDTLMGNSIYVDGDSLVLEDFNQFAYSAYIGSAILLDEGYNDYLVQLPAWNIMVGDTAILCSQSPAIAMCNVAKKGGHFSSIIDSTKTYGPWMVLRLTMLNTPENKKEILNFAINEDIELCGMDDVRLYGCLGKNDTDVDAFLEYDPAKEEFQMKFFFDGDARYSADSAAALKIALANIESAIQDGDLAKVAALTGLKSSDPYMELFKIASVKGGVGSTRYFYL